MTASEIGNKIKELPEHLIPQVSDYVELLLNKYGSKASEGAKPNKFRFDWEGGLSELKGEYTSVELQHKASDWR